MQLFYFDVQFLVSNNTNSWPLGPCTPALMPAHVFAKFSCAGGEFFAKAINSARLLQASEDYPVEIIQAI